jgi:trimeric autotransporter adhesin
LAATTINNGDTIVGGAGTDTLTITSTAANNTSLTGLTVSGVETVNIVGANNLAASTTVAAAPTAGAAQVRVLDIAGARYMGEVQTVDFAGVTIGTAGTIVLGGLTTVTLALADGPQAIATKVKTALDALTTGEITSVTQSGSLLTVRFAPTSSAAATPGADADPADTRLSVAAGTAVAATGSLTIVGQVVTTFANSDAVTVTINGIDHATVALTVPTGLGVPATVAPAAPTVVTTQGVTAVGAVAAVTAVTETNTVTFAAHTTATASTYTVADRTLSIGAAVANLTGTEVAALFAGGTLPAGATLTGALTGFTAGTPAGAVIVFTSTTAGANVPAIAVSGGATVTATTQGVAAVAAVPAVTAVTESSVVTFGGLNAGQSVTVAGQTLTATATLTAAQVATAFGSGVAPTGSSFGGALTNFNAAAAVGTAVTFTATTAGAVTDIGITTAGNTVTADTATNLTATRDAVRDVITRVLGGPGGTVTVGDGDDAGEIKLTSKILGAELPTITVSQGTTSRSSVDTGDGATAAAAARTQASAARQVVSFTVEDGTTANFGTDSAFELFVNGQSVGVTALGGATTEAQAATALAAAINAALGISAAAITAGATPLAVAVGSTVTVTAPVAGTALPQIGVRLTPTTGTGAGESITFAEVVPNTQVVGTTTTLGAAAVSGAQFVDATLVNLSDASGSATVTAAAGQTIGFTGVTMANTVAFGTATSGSLAINGSAGTLTVTGAAMTALNVSGTGSTGLTITDGSTSATTGVDPITTLNLSTTGATVLTTSAMDSLATLTQTGAGGVTLTPGTRLGTITTGAGADTIRVSTATVVDNVGTTINETVNAVVSTGAGGDRIVIATTGTGNTTVDAGDGDDTVVVSTLGSGTNSIALGAGNDTIEVGTISNMQRVSIDGGAGSNTLRTTTTAFTTADYATLVANASGIGTLEVTGAATTALDASFVSATTFSLRNGGTITEVSNADTVVLARTAAVATSTTFGVTAASAVVPAALTISSLGYVLDTNPALAGNQTAQGDNLNVTLTNTSATTTVAANGNALNLSIAALAQSGSSSATNVTGISSSATVTGDVVALNTTLTSARGSGTNGVGQENTAGLTVALTETNLDDLASISVTGAGVVNINAGTLTALTASLTSINLSGMTALANLNTLGQEWDGISVGLFQNVSTSAITLNDNISETVTLGGARDTVTTGSKAAALDTITGFQLTASALNPLLVDASRSDVLDLGTAGGTAFSGALAVGTAGHAAKMVVTGSTIEAALLQAAGLQVLNTSGVLTNVENVVFHFGGDTYVYQDVGANGLTDTDFLVRLTGLQNLDLLIGGSVLGG